jgi:hypothetical protein
VEKKEKNRLAMRTTKILSMIIISHEAEGLGAPELKRGKMGMVSYIQKLERNKNIPCQVYHLVIQA